MIALQLVAILLAGILDRIRGDAWHFGSRAVDKALLGYCMAVVAGFPFDPLVTPLIVIAMMLGMSTGWGQPLGAGLFNRPMIAEKLEWWQFGPLKTNVWLALTARGVIWGAPVAVIGLLEPSLWWFLPAYAIAFPASVIIARKVSAMKDNQSEDTSWKYAEYARGWLAAVLVFASTFL